MNTPATDLPIRVDRRLIGWMLLAAALMCWPMAFTGRPAYIADSISYLRGGQAAVDFVIQGVLPDAGGGSGDAASGAAAADAAKGARSIVYSVVAYLARFPGNSMGLLVGLHALIVGLMLAMLARGFGVDRTRDFVLVAGTIALATPAAPTTSFAIPDILAGVAIAVWVLIACCWSRLSIALRLALVAIGAFAVTAHASHLPLAAGLAAVAVALLWVAGLRGRALANRAGIALAPLVLGIAATIVSGMIGFGTVSVAPKRYPLTLARSIEDGPGRWHLERHCAERRYAVCDIFGGAVPETVPDILWGDRGIVTRATPAQFERIREEEQTVVVAAAREFPVETARVTLVNIGRQLVAFDLSFTPFDVRIVRAANGELAFLPARPLPGAVVAVSQWLSILSAVAALLWLAWRWRALEPRERIAVALMLAGLVGNAVVCAVFSGAAPRYQARVIWLLPLLALVLAVVDARRGAPGSRG